MSLILDGTNGLSDVDGTAAAPAIRGTDTNTGIFFPAADTIAFAEGGAEVMRLNASGNLQTIGTISVGNATPSTSGAGITFPATQSASSDANTLDDYEEGTWTPVVAGGSTAGTGTYTLQEGTYTKIGNMVVANCGVTWTAHTGTGDLTITGLPFTASSANTQAGSVFANEFNAGTLATQVFAFPSGSSNTILFRGFVNNATRTVPAIDTAASLGVTLTYRI